ncbi:MAG: carbohydrate kinase family protein [Pseudomonadota bacterium]
MMAQVQTAARPIICAGNWIVDIVHTIDHWPANSDLARIKHADQGVGGGAANVAFALKALDGDLDIVPVGRVGTDEYGDFIVRSCETAGLPIGHLSRDPQAPTAHTHVMNLAGDSRTFFYQGGANDAFTSDHVPVAQLGGSGIFYFGYLMLLGRFDSLRSDGSTMAGDMLRDVRAAGMVTCVDIVSAAHDDFAKIVAAALPHVDYLIINEVEAGRVTGGALADRASMEAAARTLLDMGVQCAVVIHTADEAIWVPKMGDAAHQPSQTLAADQIVSPVGAGDAFCAGVLYGLHQHWSPETCLALAHRAAAASLGKVTATEGIPAVGSLMNDAPMEPEVKAS